jgi:hypothetical protein
MVKSKAPHLFFLEAFTFVKLLRSFVILDHYPRYPYIPSVIGGYLGELLGCGVRPLRRKTGTRGGGEETSVDARGLFK